MKLVRLLRHDRRTYMALVIARRLPRWLKYWTVVAATADASTERYPDQEVPGLLAMDVIATLEPERG